jgi:hypothetical protein
MDKLSGIVLSTMTSIFSSKCQKSSLSSFCIRRMARHTPLFTMSSVRLGLIALGQRSWVSTRMDRLTSPDNGQMNARASWIGSIWNPVNIQSFHCDRDLFCTDVKLPVRPDYSCEAISSHQIAFRLWMIETKSTSLLAFAFLLIDLCTDWSISHHFISVRTLYALVWEDSRWTSGKWLLFWASRVSAPNRFIPNWCRLMEDAMTLSIVQEWQLRFRQGNGAGSKRNLS